MPGLFFLKENSLSFRSDQWCEGITDPQDKRVSFYQSNGREMVDVLLPEQFLHFYGHNFPSPQKSRFPSGTILIQK